MKIIMTGTTGMVGEGVLLKCLADNRITTVLAISRKPSGIIHPKLKELLIDSFLDLDKHQQQLTGYDACFYCAGISSVGITEEQYHHITYTLTIRFAEILLNHNPSLKFIYISGASTDSTEKSKIMWARVKGKTENKLASMSFTDHYNFRPGLMKPRKGQIHLRGFNKYMRAIYPILNLFYTGCTLDELGAAMINACDKGYGKKIVEATDIKILAKI